MRDLSGGHGVSGISTKMAIYVREFFGRPDLHRGQQLILVLFYPIYIFLADGCESVRFFENGKSPLSLLLGLFIDIDARAASGGDSFHIYK
jgi:hypothetical protein